MLDVAETSEDLTGLTIINMFNSLDLFAVFNIKDHLLQTVLKESWKLCREITTPPSKLYIPKGPYVASGLPAAINRDNCLDLTRLPGDLDDETAQSKVVQELITAFSNADRIPDALVDGHLLLGGTGCGKTKALLDVAGLRYSILFDASSAMQLDVHDMICNIKIASEMIKGQPSTLESRCNVIVWLTVCARLIALITFLWTHKDATPAAWRDCQVNSLPALPDFLQIYCTLSKRFNENNWLEARILVSQLAQALFAKTGNRIVIAIDAANNWNTQNVHNTTLSHQSNGPPTARTFLTVIAQAIQQMMGVVVLIAGTRILITSIMYLQIIHQDRRHFIVHPWSICTCQDC
jgi:hypothetical protein